MSTFRTTKPKKTGMTPHGLAMWKASPVGRCAIANSEAVLRNLKTMKENIKEKTQ
jgi:hypothetical protein